MATLPDKARVVMDNLVRGTAEYLRCGWWCHSRAETLINGVPPNYLTGEAYSIRFRAPGAGAQTALMGDTDSDFTDGPQRIDDIVVQGGSNLRQLNLPVDPNGVIYDSVARTPVSGATVTMVFARDGQPLPAACFDDPNQQSQVTLGDGYYRFDINFSDPACPSGGSGFS